VSSGGFLGRAKTFWQKRKDSNFELKVHPDGIGVLKKKDFNQLEGRQ
jgi:hypothetical protein